MVKLTQNSWLGGQLDAEMAGRQDVQRYRAGASVLKNFLPVRRGSIRKRPGTNFAWDITAYVGAADGKFRMIPFRYTPSEGYVLVICEGKGRIYGTDGTFYRDVQGSMPYKAGELGDIVYTQCGDVLYLAHPNHPPAEIDHGQTQTTIETVWGEWGVSYGTLFQPDAPEGGRVEYGHETFEMADGVWQLRYTSTTYPNPDPTAGEEGTPYEIIYTSEEKDENATGFGFTGYTVNGGEKQETNVSARRSKSETTVTEVVGADQFYYKALPNYARVEPPTVKSSTISRNKVTTDYRGGAVCLRYAASVVAMIDGTLYESKISELEPYGSADSEAGSGTQVSWSGTYYYAPWTDSMTVKVAVQLNGGSSGQTVKEVRLYKHNGTCYGLIAVKEGTWKLDAGGTAEVSIADTHITPDTSASPLEEKDVFSREGEYPACVSLYQQRLVWASSDNSPNRIWMSAAGDFYEHRTHEALQTSDPIDFVMPLVDGVGINFIVELGKLFAFTDASEYLIGSDSSTTGVTYETIMTTRQSGLGCSRRLPPIVANNSLIFCERNGQSVRNFGYDIQQNLYGGEDLSVFSCGIFDEKQIVDWTYQQSPESTVWCVLSDGSLAALTYMKDQDICAWSVHELGGGGIAKAVARTFALVGNANANTTTSEVVIAVERDGRLCLEVLRPWGMQSDLPKNAVCMDGVVSGDRSADGLTYVAEAGVSGWPFESVMTTMQPIIGDNVGNAQFDVKNVHHAHLRMRGSVGGSVRAANYAADCAAKLKTTTLPVVGADGLMAFGMADESVVLYGSNNRDGRVTVEQDEPWPFQLVLLELDAEAEEGDE